MTEEEFLKGFGHIRMQFLKTEDKVHLYSAVLADGSEVKATSDTKSKRRLYLRDLKPLSAKVVKESVVLGSFDA